MDLAHLLERPVENFLHAREVAQVALDDLGACAERADRVRGAAVGTAGALHEADGRAGLREREGAGLADACKDASAQNGSWHGERDRGRKGGAKLERRRATRDICAEAAERRGGCERAAQRVNPGFNAPL